MAPKTTRNTPTSKKNGVPRAGWPAGHHTPVRKGCCRIRPSAPEHRATRSPSPTSCWGRIRRPSRTASGPSLSTTRAKPVAATRAAINPPPGAFVPAPEQVDRKHQHQSAYQSRGRAQDNRFHGVSFFLRINVHAARADAATTVISPMVSRPRKSTRITLTILRPWAIR